MRVFISIRGPNSSNLACDAISLWLNTYPGVMPDIIFVGRQQGAKRSMTKAIMK
jgi:hypothetical protein